MRVEWSKPRGMNNSENKTVSRSKGESRHRAELTQEVKKSMNGIPKQKRQKQSERGMHTGKLLRNCRKAKQFTIPAFQKYDGSTDRVDHIRGYKQMMQIETSDEKLICKIFPTSLTGPAAKWFQDLKTQSISSLDYLSRVLVSQYFCSCEGYGSTILHQEERQREDWSAYREVQNRDERNMLLATVCGNRVERRPSIRHGPLQKSYL